MDEKVQLDPVVPSAPVTPTEPVSNYAKWYSRSAANIIDSLIIFFVLCLFIFPTTIIAALIFPESNSPAALFIQGIIQLLSSIAVFAYYGYFLSKEGATPGLKVLGIKAIKEDGTLLTFWQAVLRTFIFQIISLINIIMILVTQKKQGAHDMVVKTVVVNVEEKQTVGKVITGFCGGCGCLLIIAMIIGIASGSSMLLNEINKSVPGINQEMTQTKPQETKQNQMRENQRETQREEMQNNNFYNMQEETLDKPTTMQERPAIMQETPMGGNSEDLSKVFYNACMNANTNPNIDLSNYCICAEKESKTTTDINAIVDRCKDQIKMR